MRTYANILGLLLLVVLLGCGGAGDRYGSITGMPAAGISPWYKVDMDPTVDLVQPYILVGDTTHYLTEPSYIISGGLHRVIYEIVEYDETGDTILGSTLAMATSADGIEWQPANDGQPVLIPDQPWEGDRVGAPALLAAGGRYLLWYVGGRGAGIGFAESDDGLVWEKSADNPVLVPDQEWEADLVAAPSVFSHHGTYRMFYSGGAVDGTEIAVLAGSAIGFADSPNGLVWTKRDAAGRTSKSDPGEVRPVLTASQPWEGMDEETGLGGVMASPCVRVDHPADRDIFRLYYTGNQVGEPVLIDTAIGYAGSFDGIHWEKLEDAYNPVLNEKFPLTLFGVSQYIVYGESAPSVVKTGNAYRMLFSQTDILGTKQGIALAVNPNVDAL
ncbi:MAG: hypothetical protein GX444_02895 [Myxococcales bacterium]|nr:hypothetical protein [Myxococcales bacterium]